ncbi:unnamed protein product [Rhizophagus irregularis]|nr:unnamed protein product [Rhizophagus irregularis]
MISLRRISAQIASKGSLFAIRPLLVLRGYATSQDVSTLLLVEHKDKSIASSTLNAFTAASKLGNNITALVAGEDPGM